MAAYDSQYLLSMFSRKAARPAGEGIPTASLYARLSESQNRVVALMQAVCPNALYPRVPYNSLPTLTTTDNQIYTFGTDANGYPVFPMGNGGIFQSLNDIPNYPLIPGYDYMLEGTQIRATNNTTLPSVLYWYGIGNPPDISGLVQPVLYPEASRELIVIDAVRQFAQEGVRNVTLEDDMAAEWDRAWPIWCLAWKTQFNDGGALGSWTGLSLALLGGQNAAYAY